MVIYMWEFPDSFGYRFSTEIPINLPNKQPWLYQAHPDHPWFNHHERGHNVCKQYNRSPTMDY